MTEPICFRCRHFKQYAPLTFITPGQCTWEAEVPAWLEYSAHYDDYYAPKRDVSTRLPIQDCQTFDPKPECEADHD